MQAQQWLSARVKSDMDDAAAKDLLDAFLEVSPIPQVRRPFGRFPTVSEKTIGRSLRSIFLKNHL